MRKRFFAILLALSIILSIAAAPAVYASETYYVADAAGVFTDDQWLDLNDRAYAISEKFGLDVAIIIIDEKSDDDSAEEWAQYMFEALEFGRGADRSGIVFFISVNDRESAIVAHGYGNTAFTDHGKDVMFDKYIVPLLKDDKYYEASSIFLDKAEEFLALAEAGTPFDVDTDEEYIAQNAKNAAGAKVAVTIIIPLIVSLIICMVWRSHMKSARKATEADSYIPSNGFDLSLQEDSFLYRTTTSRKIERSSNSSGGTTVNSGGYSGSSRKF